MKLANFEFRASIWPSAFFVLLFPLFLSLGIWQLHRADEKEEIIEELAVKKNSKPEPIEMIDPASDVYHPVILRGEFEGQIQLLMDNRIYQGKAGYEILSVFKLYSNGQAVLVNRGWVETGLDRNVLPILKFKEESQREVVGLFTRPSRGFVLGDPVTDYSDQWPKVIHYIDYEAITKLTGLRVIPGVVQLDSEEQNEYPRIWQPVAFGPEKHYGYALQWFLIAAVLVVLYVVLNTKE